MPIEFRCLNCRNTLLADESDAGEKMECEECGLRVTVPKPIGGELTDKRLRTSVAPPPPSIRLKPKDSDEAVAVEEAATSPTDQHKPSSRSTTKVFEQRYFDLESQPRHGFDFTVKFPDEPSREFEFETLVRSAARIREALLNYLEDDPQYFMRGSLVMIVNRWRAEYDGNDINVRLAGLLNDEEVSHYFYSHRTTTASTGAIHFGALGVILVNGINYLRWKFWRTACLNRFHRQMVKSVIAELAEVLDDTAQRPVSTWTRFNRYLRRQM